jgi:hypothetical protein
VCRPHLVEAKRERVIVVEDKGRPRLVDRIGGDLVLDAELAQEGNDRRHEGLANEDRRTLTPVEESDGDALAGQEGSEHRAGGSGAHDRHAPDATG